ncbi:hypothetical protein BJ508DRAFT_414035 [Ascobolus immersus RN42]|uniref:Large ribosomal subunit protein bL21m n=1 Tax=Ascobolus immersus RN42 TaxID=1160509 RepID=A0A3N4I965_ASCIM|nr:hypothetical protein BJ508DRAFT_414035 [Ascobolus immersus RN42]
MLARSFTRLAQTAAATCTRATTATPTIARSAILAQSRFLSSTPKPAALETAASSASTSTPPPSADAPVVTPADPSTLQLLTRLALQPPHYITIQINGFPFLVTSGDTVRLPFLLKDVNVGDSLRITHASVLGSREFTMKGNPYIDEKFFECKARVVEVTSEPMRYKLKKKQRTRRTKTVKSKHRYTVLRIGDIKVNAGLE